MRCSSIQRAALDRAYAAFMLRSAQARQAAVLFVHCGGGRSRVSSLVARDCNGSLPVCDPVGRCSGWKPIPLDMLPMQCSHLSSQDPTAHQMRRYLPPNDASRALPIWHQKATVSTMICGPIDSGLRSVNHKPTSPSLIRKIWRGKGLVIVDRG